MMSERTLIVVNDYDIYKGRQGGPDFRSSPTCRSMCLVFVYDLIEYKADARTKLAGCSKPGSVVPFNRQGQNDLVDWISRRFRALDHDIGTEDAKYLMFLCGDLMNGLILGDRQDRGLCQGLSSTRVTRADIDAVATPSWTRWSFR